jgi:hypothetical protein
MAKSLYMRLKPQHKKELKERAKRWPATTQKMTDALDSEEHVTELKLGTAMDIHTMGTGPLKGFNYLELYEMFKSL